LPPLLTRLVLVTGSSLAWCKAVASKAANVALWPLGFLERKIRKGNLLLIRWAMRNDSKFAFLFALFWSTAVSIVFTGWIIWSIPLTQPGAVSATMVLIIAFGKKFVIFITSADVIGTRVMKYWKHYQRQFGRSRR
jgi:hypothetical protein